jgi:hypothetical protein
MHLLVSILIDPLGVYICPSFLLYSLIMMPWALPPNKGLTRVHCDTQMSDYLKKVTFKIRLKNIQVVDK